MRLVTFRDPGGATRIGRLDDDRVVVLRAPTMIEWLAGEDREESGTRTSSPR